MTRPLILTFLQTIVLMDAIDDVCTRRMHPLHTPRYPSKPLWSFKIQPGLTSARQNQSSTCRHLPRALLRKSWQIQVSTLGPGLEGDLGSSYGSRMADRIEDPVCVAQGGGQGASSLDGWGPTPHTESTMVAGHPASQAQEEGDEKRLGGKNERQEEKFGPKSPRFSFQMRELTDLINTTDDLMHWYSGNKIYA